jgi:hypothetical protein
MKLPERRDKCIEDLAAKQDNLDICFKISTQGGQEDCAYKIAQNRKSFAVCDEIKTENYRNDCIQGVIEQCNSIKKIKWAEIPSDCEEDALKERNIPEQAPEGTFDKETE